MALEPMMQDLLRYGTQALRVFGPSTDGVDILTDAAIAPLTTVAGLKALLTAAPISALQTEHDLAVLKALEAIDIATNYGYLSDAIVAAANTFAGIITAMQSGIDSNEVENFATNYGGDRYFGTGTANYA